MKATNPRHGSMQFWPRKRVKKETPRIRAWATSKDAKPLAFPGYKAGMTHVIAIDNRKNSTSAGQDISIPVTVIECPPMKIYAVRGYEAEGYGSKVAKETIVSNDKQLMRKLDISKKPAAFKAEDFKGLDISVLVYTQPAKIGFKKKPDVFEVNLGGNEEEQLTYIKDHIDKDIAVADILGEGELIDVHAVTKGKGFQGAVKRFGIGLKASKSEKGRRTPGSLGGWKGHAHFMYRIAHAGQMGYHQRVQYNNQILKISDKTEDVNPKGAFINYGEVKNSYVLVKGSVAGPKKRLIVMTKPVRQKVVAAAPTVIKIDQTSKQRR